jgi:FtsP/CotA-like multicopper oxidase with cupredoxin domain
MTDKLTLGRFTRREFLALGGQVALLGLLAGSAIMTPTTALAVPETPAVTMRFAATDAILSFPGRRPDYNAPVADQVFDPNGIYFFGFVPASPTATIPQVVNTHKGQVQIPAPIIGVNEGQSLGLTLTNVGLLGRPDLDDSHTVHWHGFRNPIALFDGVPEVSIAVPVNRDFRYFYRPQDPGTYMYHCHFEDTEHVQMGMTGVVFVRPAQNGNIALYPSGKYAYNDGNGSTGYHREFALLLNELDTHPHDGLIAVQEFVWSDYRPNFWIINGRSYPDTVERNNHPGFPRQPISSLIQVNAGERALLRLVNLGYEQHAMQLAGIPMKVVGEDATLLRGPAPDNADLSYTTNTIYIGPGEARDVLFTAPAFNGSGPTGTDLAGPYNPYLFMNRSPHKNTNGTEPGLGGMVTEVRVYAPGTLGAQTAPNQTYPL